jgi:hypothetical protein
MGDIRRRDGGVVVVLVVFVDMIVLLSRLSTRGLIERVVV